MATAFNRRSNGKQPPPAWIVPGEEELVKELVADQFAFGALAMELRRHPELQPVGFSGIALALAFVALKEFPQQEYEGGKRRIKGATFRMSRQLHWGRLTVQLGGMSEASLETGNFFWGLFIDLLKMVEEIPSPIYSRLVQTADRPVEDWRIASNHLLKWCTFGDREKVFAIIRKIRDSALKQAAVEHRARRVLDVIGFLLNDTHSLEPTLGLRAALEE